MSTLQNLGLSKAEDLPDGFAARFHELTGFHLPPEFLDFLTYSLPEGFSLSFHFLREPERKTWEGQISEFSHLPNRTSKSIAESVIIRAGMHLLPIGCDAGGNYVWLDLQSGVVWDLDYESGICSQVSPNFADFLSSLRRSE